MQEAGGMLGGGAPGPGTGGLLLLLDLVCRVQGASRVVAGGGQE